MWLDSAYCIVNKPANICIDGTDSITMEKLTTSTLDAMGHEYGGKIRNCHQLDKLTSGLLIYGLAKKATTKMNQLMQNRKISKIYYAVVHGHITETAHFLLDFPIAENGRDPKREQIGNDQNEGRPSITECWVESIGYFKSVPVSVLRVRLWTGRKHQIRLHLSHIGHAVVGDPAYSERAHLFDRLYLDAHRMIFGKKRQRIDVQTESNQEFHKLIMDQNGSNLNRHSDHGEDEEEQLLLDHDVYRHSLLVPFIMNSDETDIQILVRKQPKSDRFPSEMYSE